MTRDEIVATLKATIADTLDNVDVASIDTSKTMKDLGANSLDIVEIVSRTMRQLKVKIPRSELNKLANIDALIDLIEQTANSGDKKAAAEQINRVEAARAELKKSHAFMLLDMRFVLTSDQWTRLGAIHQ